MTVLVVLIVVVLVAAVAAAWLLPAGSTPGLVTVGVLVVGLIGLALVALLHGPVEDDRGLLSRLLLVPMLALAALGGGPVTATVLHLVDREDGRFQHGRTGVEAAASVLRGGAWIGGFERTGVFATLVAGWPEGIAVVLGLKGLGRYSELKSDGPSTGREPAPPVQGGVAERFIIGTFCSVLWAVACAGVVAGLLA
jgi:hypothetical protein